MWNHNLRKTISEGHYTSSSRWNKGFRNLYQLHSKAWVNPISKLMCFPKGCCIKGQWTKQTLKIAPPLLWPEKSWSDKSFRFPSAVPQVGKTQYNKKNLGQNGIQEAKSLLLNYIWTILSLTLLAFSTSSLHIDN